MLEKKSTSKKRVPVKKPAAKKSRAAGSRSAGKAPAKRKPAVKKVAVKKSRAAGSRPAGKVTVKEVEELEVDIHQPAAVPLMIYRRIAVTFIFVVAAALVAVLYLATVQAVIHVDSTETFLKAQFIANIYETPIQETDVRGVVRSGTLGRTQTFEPTWESTTDVVGFAMGTVTITNEMNFPQQLVATTRFLTPEGVLFRLEDGVTVPAGGSVDGIVRADQAGEVGDIAASSFSIPGLSSARQRLVYAQSAESFTGGVTTVAVVAQSELDTAAQSLQDELVMDAKNMLRAEVGEVLLGESFEVTVDEQVFSIEGGANASAFDVTMTVTVTAVYYDDETLEKIAVAKLYEGLGQGQMFLSVDTEQMTVAVEVYDIEEQEANVHVYLEAPAITSQTSDAMEVSRFVGMDEQEVRDLLVGEGVATDVYVEFFPFWVSSVPRLKDHIYIDIR